MSPRRVVMAAASLAYARLAQGGMSSVSGMSTRSLGRDASRPSGGCRPLPAMPLTAVPRRLDSRRRDIAGADAALADGLGRKTAMGEALTGMGVIGHVPGRHAYSNDRMCEYDNSASAAVDRLSRPHRCRYTMLANGGKRCRYKQRYWTMPVLIPYPLKYS